MNKKRHSNYPPGMFQEIPGSGDYENLPDDFYEGVGSGSGSGSGLGKDNSGSGMFDWGGFVNNLLTAGTSLANSIWGKNNINQANYTNQLYEQEKRTNTILWVVIGLIVALGVFLVIRKTK